MGSVWTLTCLNYFCEYAINIQNEKHHSTVWFDVQSWMLKTQEYQLYIIHANIIKEATWQYMMNLNKGVLPPFC